MSAEQSGRVERRKAVDFPYARSEHKRIAELTDPVAQSVFDALRELGVNGPDMRFSVYLDLEDANSVDCLSVEAIRFDPTFDYDAEVTRAFASGLTGYALHGEMPGDVAFQVYGKSYGMFLGGWIEYGFKQKFASAHEGEEPARPFVVRAIRVNGWQASEETVG